MHDVADAWVAVAPLTVHSIASTVATTRGTTTLTVSFYLPEHDDGNTNGLTATGYAALTLPYGFGNVLNSGFTGPTSVSLSSVAADDTTTSLGTTMGMCSGNTVYVLMDEESEWTDDMNYTLSVVGVPTP